MARGTSATQAGSTRPRTQPDHPRDERSQEAAVPAADQAAPIAPVLSLITSRSRKIRWNVQSSPHVAKKSYAHFCAQEDDNDPNCIHPYVALIDEPESQLSWRVEDFHCASRLITILLKCGIAVRPEALHDINRIHSILRASSGVFRGNVLELKQSDAVLFLNLLIKVFNLLVAKESLFSSELRNWMAELSFKAGQLPSTIFVDDIELSSSSIIAAGGAQADIFRGTHESQQVALKAPRVFTATPKTDLQLIHKAFCKEAMLWWKLDHPNVLPVVGVSRLLLSQYPHRLALVTPWMPSGNLLSFISEHPKVDRLQLLSHAASAVKYLHDEHIVHGDIKAANILVKKTFNSYNSQLADMGLSDPSASQSMVLASGCSGSQNWMAPELFGQNTRNTKASDVFAFGMTCFEVLTGEEPFKGHNAPAVQISNGARPLQPLIDSPQYIGDPVWHLLQSMWKTEASERCMMDEVLSKLRKYSGSPPEPEDVVSVITLAEDQHPFPAPSYNVAVPMGALPLNDIVKKSMANIGQPKSTSRRLRTAFEAVFRPPQNPA